MQSNTKSKIGFTMILLGLLFAGLSAYADVPAAPRDYHAMVMMATDSQQMFASWIENSDADPADGYQFWMGKIDKDGNVDYQMVKDAAAGEVEKEEMNAMSFCFLEFELDIEAGEYMSYMLAYNGDGESEKSNETKIQVRDSINIPMQRLYFVSDPPNEKILIGEEFTYDADAESKDPDDVIRYKIAGGPDDMEIDAETGVVTWTPEEAGHYHVWLQAYAEGNEEHTADQFFGIEVTSCAERTVISGTVKNENDEPIEIGYVLIYHKPLDSTNHHGQVFEGKVENGRFEVNVDEGTYYVFFDSMVDISDTSFISYGEWYEDAVTMKDATPIEIKCGDIVDITMIVGETPDYNKYTVSGTVTLEDGSPVAQAFVEFMAVEGHPGMMIPSDYSTTTDADGNYQIELPDLFGYIAMAYSYNHFMPLYFDQTMDPKEAEVIELTGDRNDIDFVFGSKGGNDWNASASGIVVNELNEALEDVFVIAFMTDTRDTLNFGQIFTGMAVVTNQNGEFEFGQMLAGDYVFFAMPALMEYAPGFYKENETAVLKWDEASVVEIPENSSVDGIEIILGSIEDLPGIIEISGNVKSSDDGLTPDAGKAINGASVYLVAENGKVSKFDKSGQNGEFALEEIAAGTYELVVDKVGYRDHRELVTLDDENGIDGMEIELYQESVSSVHDDEIPSGDLNLFPNPADDFTTMTFSNLTGNVSVVVSDLNGTILSESAMDVLSGTNSILIETDNLANGMYYVKIKNGTKSAVLPLVVSR